MTRPRCRQMETRLCPWLEGCVARTCARFGPADPDPQLLDDAPPPLRLRPLDPPPEAA